MRVTFVWESVMSAMAFHPRRKLLRFAAFVAATAVSPERGRFFQRLLDESIWIVKMGNTHSCTLHVQHTFAHSLQAMSHPGNQGDTGPAATTAKPGDGWNRAVPGR
jgi:hypothetical protein